MSFSEEIQDSYYETMKNIYEGKYGCSCKYLKSKDLYNTKLVNELVNWADIIYEGGGNTSPMISLWKETGFDIILNKAWNDGKVICGISAGAVCWFNSCNSDTVNNSFEVISCLNWIDIFMTPHCDEKGRYESTKEQLKQNNMIGLMLSNCSAIEILDNKYKIICSETNRPIKKGYVIKCYWKNNTFHEEKLESTNNYQPLSNLLNK